MKSSGVCALVLLMLAASVSAQSLADVARKEAQRRKGVKEPARVLTNSDLPAPVPPPPDATPPAAAAADDAAKDKSEAAERSDKSEKAKGPAESPKDQAYWSGRLKELQAQLDRDRIFADALQSRINALTTDFVNRDDPAQRTVIERDRQKAVSELARLKDVIQKDKVAIDDLNEEARRAAVPPGWLR